MNAFLTAKAPSQAARVAKKFAMPAVQRRH
jgi:hypothetical protein